MSQVETVSAQFVKAESRGGEVVFGAAWFYAVLVAKCCQPRYVSLCGDNVTTDAVQKPSMCILVRLLVKLYAPQNTN